jgi:hypothetical protein
MGYIEFEGRLSEYNDLNKDSDVAKLPCDYGYGVFGFCPSSGILKNTTSCD